ncbi:oligosaccharide flippase family protein [Thermodesulfobacteriota bacterium]
MSNENPSAESSKTKLIRGGLATYGIKILSVGLGFTAQFLIARFLGEVGYGEYSFALVTLEFLVIGAVAGSDAVATRFISLVSDSPRLLKECLRWLNKRAWIYSIILTVVALAVLQITVSYYPRNIWLVTQVICIGLPFQVFSTVRQGILRGLQQPVASQVPELLVRPVLVIVLLLSLAFVFADRGILPLHVAWITVLATGVVLLVGQILLGLELSKRRTFSNERDESNDSATSNAREPMEENYRKWFSMAWASMFAAAAMTIHSKCDLFMLGVLTENNLGAYAAATRYAAFTIFGINAINIALGPLVALSSNDQQKLQQLASQAAFLSFLLAIGVGIVLLIFPKYLLGWFGPGFDQTSVELQILVLANLFNVVCGSVGMLLNMSGYHRDFLKVLLVSVILNVLLNGSLIPFLGTKGAAIATAVATVSWNLMGLILVRKRLNVRPSLGGWI